jgi:hypothetical protein
MLLGFFCFIAGIPQNFMIKSKIFSGGPVKVDAPWKRPRISLEIHPQQTDE